jgi:hypothetical protein
MQPFIPLAPLKHWGQDWEIATVVPAPAVEVSSYMPLRSGAGLERMPLERMPPLLPAATLLPEKVGGVNVDLAVDGDMTTLTTESHHLDQPHRHRKAAGGRCRRANFNRVRVNEARHGVVGELSDREPVAAL